jgi:hypothetical protein
MHTNKILIGNCGVRTHAVLLPLGLKSNALTTRPNSLIFYFKNYFILFLKLFYFILFYFILFYFILFYLNPSYPSPCILPFLIVVQIFICFVICYLLSASSSAICYLLSAICYLLSASSSASSSSICFVICFAICFVVDPMNIYIK